MGGRGEGMGGGVGGDLHLRVWRRLRGSHELQPLLQIQLKQMLAG